MQKTMPEKEAISTLYKAKWILTGVAVGGLAAYYLDEKSGRRRRALVRDKTVHIQKETQRTFMRQWQDTKNRLQGVAAKIRHRFAGLRELIAGQAATDANLSNAELTERVRSTIGRAIENGQWIDVVAEQGCITLKGAIHPDEVQTLMQSVIDISGVMEVRNHMVPRAFAPKQDDTQGEATESESVSAVAQAQAQAQA